MLDWIFEGIVTWISRMISELMDAVSGLFLDALGTDMTAMEEYFPFVTKAFTIMQYTAWAILFLITVWQLFRVFGGPITEAENPWTLLARSSLSALLIAYAKPIFSITLDIATAPYTALIDVEMTTEDFTFVGVENALKNTVKDTGKVQKVSVTDEKQPQPHVPQTGGNTPLATAVILMYAVLLGGFLASFFGCCWQQAAF